VSRTTSSASPTESAISASRFDLGWITKGIEVAIAGLVIVDLLSAYGDLGGLWRAAIGSLRLSPVGED
jgi:hypothetical protein